MGIGQIPASPEYTFLVYSGVQRLVFDHFILFFFGQVHVWVTPPPFLYFFAFARLYVLLFFCLDVKTKERKNVRTNKCLFVRSFVCLYKWTYSKFSLSLSLSPMWWIQQSVGMVFKTISRHRLVNRDPEMVIGECISPSPDTSLPNTFGQCHYR